jgi:hypothetical protein
MKLSVRLPRIFYVIFAFLSAVGTNNVFADTLSELSDCRVPQQVRFSREYDPSIFTYRMNRYVKYATDPGLVLQTSKNTEWRPAASPSFMTNCSNGYTAGKTVMNMQFFVKTQNYFADQPGGQPSIGDHLAIAGKATFYGETRDDIVNHTVIHDPLQSTGNTVSYTARGIVLGLDPYQDVQAELFDNYHRDCSGSSLPCPYVHQEVGHLASWGVADNIEYFVDVWVSETGVSYTVYDQWSNLIVDHDFWEANTLSLSGTGFGFVPLCRGTSPACEYSGEVAPAFDVHIYGLNITWY